MEDKFNYIKINNFCLLEGTIRKVKRWSTLWEKIFAAPIASKALLSSIYRLLSLSITTNSLITKGGNLGKICEYSITGEET